MIGRIIGNYRITSELAHGGMGTVYRGQHLNLPREIVVKSILLGAFSPSAQSHLKARFRREAYIQSQLDHPNIVRVYEFFTAEDNYYLVMEFVPGMSLRELLTRQGVPTPAQAVYLCKQALSALDYAHNYTYVDESDLRHTGIIHRDIKPANMLLDNKGKLKITDFGIVKVLGEPNTGGGMTQTGFHPGTVEYMSPEQLLGLDIDVRSDLYSLGVTFYEMLTGRLPFQRSATGSDWEIRKGHIEVAPPPILELRPDLPTTLAAIIMRSLQKSPNERYQSAAEFLDALQTHERTVGADQLAKTTTSGRLTKPLFPAPTAPDAATLLAGSTQNNQPPIVAPAPPFVATRSALEEAETIPLIPVKTEKPNSTPATTDEQTIVAVKPKASKNRFALVAGACGFLLTGAVGGAYFYSGQNTNRDNLAAQMTPSPTPTALVTETTKPTAKPKATATVQSLAVATQTPAPTPAATPNLAERASAILNQAKSLEDSEQYSAAIAKYLEYKQINPDSAAAGLVDDKLRLLTIVSRMLDAAKADMDAKRYSAAIAKYQQALRLKNNSTIARTGEAEARSKMTTEMPNVQIDRPALPQGQNPNGRRIPPTLKRLPKPTPQAE
ncbi:MAG: protein kinase domain-containing protein [Blastocatellia bacterium]